MKSRRAKARWQSGQSSLELLLVLPFVFFTMVAIVQVCMTALGGELTYYTAFMGARARTAGHPSGTDNVRTMVDILGKTALPWAGTGAVQYEETSDGGVRVTAPAPPIIRSLSADYPLEAKVRLLPLPPLEASPRRWSEKAGDNDLF